MDIIFWGFLILYQIFFSPQVRRNLIISNKHRISSSVGKHVKAYGLSNLGKFGKISKLHTIITHRPTLYPPSPPPKKSPVDTMKKPKTRNQNFPEAKTRAPCPKPNAPGQPWDSPNPKLEQLSWKRALNLALLHNEPPDPFTEAQIPHRKTRMPSPECLFRKIK